MAVASSYNYGGLIIVGNWSQDSLKLSLSLSADTFSHSGIREAIALAFQSVSSEISPRHAQVIARRTNW